MQINVTYYALRACVCEGMYKYEYIGTLTYIYIYIYIHTHTYIYIYTSQVIVSPLISFYFVLAFFQHTKLWYPGV